jgi:hypothetical protein
MSYINSRPMRNTCGTPNPKTYSEPPLRGLGDLVERVAEKTGVKAVVEKVAKATNKDCGCNKRKAMLNRLMPFRTEDETTEASND